MIIMPHPYGRMANRLSHAAAFIAHAEESGDTFVYLGLGRYHRFFQGTRKSPFLIHRPAHPRPHPKTRLIGLVNIWFTNDRRGEDLDMAGPAFLDKQRRTRFLFTVGWLFRDPAATQKHAPLIRRIFTPAEPHLSAIRRAAEAARRGADHLIGVHIRQTDYQTFVGGQYFYAHDTYARIMRDLAAQLPGRTRFLICSDAPVPLAPFRGLDTLPGPGHPLQDNYTLAACDRIIGPPSSYSHWAAYYGDIPLHQIESANATVTL